jgi:hypothetical protein
MTKDKIQTDVEEHKFKSDLLHQLDRIASALERLMAVCNDESITTTAEEEEEETLDHFVARRTGSLGAYNHE